MICRFLVTGVVQGVGYRWFAARHARELGLSGFAQNMGDGRVEVVAAGGDAAAMSRLEAMLRAGPAHARVDAVERHDNVTDPQVPTRSFDIR